MIMVMFNLGDMLVLRFLILGEISSELKIYSFSKCPKFHIPIVMQ